MRNRVTRSPYIPFTPTLKQWALLMAPQLEVLYGGGTGGAKDEYIENPILTTRGPSTIGALQVGDQVFDHLGHPTQVIAKTEVFRHRTCYRVTLDNGAAITVGAGHLWTVTTRADLSRFFKAHPAYRANRRATRPSRSVGTASARPWLTAGVAAASNTRRADAARAATPGLDPPDLPDLWDYTRTLTTAELAELVISETHRVRIPAGAPLLTKGDWCSAIDPYLLGFWIGDGNSNSGQICTGAQDIAAVRNLLPDLSWRSRLGNNQTTVLHLANTGLTSTLRAENQLHNKHIPDWVYNAPYDDRLALFQGIMDTDGTIAIDGGASLTMARETLLRDIHRLAHTLGLSPSQVRYRRTTNSTPGFSGHAWSFRFRPDTSTAVFRLPRKLARQRSAPSRIGNGVSILSVIETPSVPTQCITVANPRGLYRTGHELTVTHNSFALLMDALTYVEVPGYHALLLRKTFRELSQPGALMNLAEAWLAPTAAVKSDGGRRWSFPCGATISFGYLENPDDRYQYASAAFSAIYFDELTEFDSSSYTFLFSRLRQPLSLSEAGVPLRMRSASNPVGRGKDWVKSRFLDTAHPERFFLSSLMADNPHLDTAAYERSLAMLDPVTARQLRHGDWEIRPEGNFFTTANLTVATHHQIYRDDTHTVPPAAWPRVRRWDLAATESASSDYTAGVRLAYDPCPHHRRYLIEDVIHRRLEPAPLEILLRATAAADAAAFPNTEIVIEQEPGASGKIVARDLRTRVFATYPTRTARPTAAKGERARLGASRVHAGEVTAIQAPWNAEFIAELAAFDGTPNRRSGEHDDQVDAFAAAFHDLSPAVNRILARAGAPAPSPTAAYTGSLLRPAATASRANRNPANPPNTMPETYAHPYDLRSLLPRRFAG